MHRIIGVTELQNTVISEEEVAADVAAARAEPDGRF
jgi:hypothetical protein